MNTNISKGLENNEKNKQPENHAHKVHQANPLLGIALKVIAVVLFIIMSSLIKSVSDHVPAGQSMFARSFFAIPIVLIWTWQRNDLLDGLKTQNLKGHMKRSFAGSTAMGMMFAGLALLPLPEVTAIGYAAPLLTVILAAVFLGETVRTFRLTTVALGMLGVLIVLSPRLTTLTSLTQGLTDSKQALGAILVLLGAVFSAFAQLFLRQMANVEKTTATVFYFSVTSTLLSLLTIPFGWVMPTSSEALMLILAGLLGGVGQIFLSSCYRFADASIIAPFEYTSMLFALLIGYFIFAEIPTATMLFGASLIIIAGVIIILRERYLAKQAKNSA
jgi:drug/metabolite transporter (DMT)-like permease